MEIYGKISHQAAGTTHPTVGLYDVHTVLYY